MEIYVHFIQQLLFFWHFYYTMYHVTFKESNKEHSSAHSDPSGLYFFFSLLRSTPVGQKPVSEQKAAAFRSVFFERGWLTVRMDIFIPLNLDCIMNITTLIYKP